MRVALDTSARGPGRCRGLSLVELMLATLLGLFLVAGMAGLYLAAKRQYFYDEQLARLQENGRYAIGLLRRELAMAGFYGGLMTTDGVAPGAVSGDCSAEAWALQTASPLVMADDHPSRGTLRTTLGTELDCIDGSDVARSTDVLAVRRTAAEASVRDGLLAPDVASYSARRWYLQVSPDHPPEWRKLAFPDLAGIAASDDQVSLWEAVARIFYIRNYSDPGDRADGLPVLCMEELAKDAMLTRCLVEGVENMQLELGIDTDGDSVANRYVSPAEVRDYVGAVSTRVSLLLRSVYPVAGLRDTRIYRLGPSRVSAPGDGHLRRVFSTTVELRNRLRRPIHVVKGADNEPV